MEEDLYDDEYCDDDVDIEETESGYRLRLSIPSAFFKFIIGKKGETKRRLENETGTQIKIPKQGAEGDIGIHLFIYKKKVHCCNTLYPVVLVLPE